MEIKTIESQENERSLVLIQVESDTELDELQEMLIIYAKNKNGEEFNSEESDTYQHTECPACGLDLRF